MPRQVDLSVAEGDGDDDDGDAAHAHEHFLWREDARFEAVG